MFEYIIVALIAFALGVVVGMYILRNNLDNKKLTGALDKGESLKDEVSSKLNK